MHFFYLKSYIMQSSTVHVIMPHILVFNRKSYIYKKKKIIIILNASAHRTVPCKIPTPSVLPFITTRGGTQFFSGRGVWHGFPKVWGLRTDTCLWEGGLVNWKFPNLGACELKIFKFGGLWAKIWAKIEAVEAKISKFSQKGVLWTDSFAWNGTLANCRRGVKREYSGPHIPIPPF